MCYGGIVFLWLVIKGMVIYHYVSHSIYVSKSWGGGCRKLVRDWWRFLLNLS